MKYVHPPPTPAKPPYVPEPACRCGHDLNQHVTKVNGLTVVSKQARCHATNCGCPVYQPVK